VEWVEVAGKTVEEATEQALDQLGVAVGDAEVIVVDEPKTGLFGRVRVEARVRARVRPVGARPRRERSRRSGGGRSGQGGQGGQGSRQGGQRSAAGGAGRNTNSSADADSGPSGAAGTNGPGTATAGTGSGTSRSARRRRNRSKATTTGAVASAEGSRNGSGEPSPEKAPQRSTEAKETEDMAEGMTLEEQGEVGRAFVADLLSEFGMEGSVETRLLDEDTVEIAALGEDLGILVGPRGSTLAALQDLTRAVVQRQCPSRTDRILVDVAGYRERRSAALKRFSVQIAEEVLASGQEKALEPMSPADRKAVHDAINEMSGVETRSEGEDPNRHIVIAPAG
jgi:spoIIIJ-associated protein